MTRTFILRSSGIHGRGLFAARDIKKGEKVGEYTGELVTRREGTRRSEEDYTRRRKVYILSVNARWDVDATLKGGPVRFANHSCQPNCEMLAEGKQAFLYAIKSIRKGEEITWDYAFECDEIDDDCTKCFCSTEKCRGTIEVVKKKKRKSAKK